MTEERLNEILAWASRGQIMVPLEIIDLIAEVRRLRAMAAKWKARTKILSKGLPHCYAYVNEDTELDEVPNVDA